MRARALRVAPEAVSDAEVHARRWRILWVLCLSLMIVMIANASLNVAIPELARALDAFLVTQYLQLVLDHSPLASSLVLLPMSFGIMVLAPRVPSLVARLGVARVAAAGLTLMSLGMGSLSGLDTANSIWMVPLAFVPLAAGMALTGPPLTTLMMSAVPLGRSGVGSAMNDTSRELGGALGVAVLGSLVTTRFTASIRPSLDGLPAQAQSMAETGLAGALSVARELSRPAGDAVAEAARIAFVDGFSIATLTAAVVLLAGAVAALLFLSGPILRPDVPAGGGNRVVGDESRHLNPSPDQINGTENRPLHQGAR